MPMLLDALLHRDPSSLQSLAARAGTTGIVNVRGRLNEQGPLAGCLGRPGLLGHGSS
jgi:hypothetical protein